MTEPDLGRLVSAPLTEVRTVLSRARTAIDRIQRIQRGETYDGNGLVNEAGRRAGFEGGFDEWRARQASPEYVIEPHPQLDEMVDALSRVVALLERWEKTGAIRRDKKR